MAEAIALISFISAVAGLVDVGARVVARLSDFQSKTHELPDALKHVKIKLPLTIDSLGRSKAKAETGELEPETQKALLPTLEACTELVNRLEELLVQLLPVNSDSAWDKKMKAIRSLTKDKDIQGLLHELDRYIAILTLHNTSISAKTSVAPPAQTLLLRTRTIPTIRDANFVDRPDLFRDIQINLGKHGRAALSGIGGVGKTQIAIEHCYRHLEYHQAGQIFWIYSASVKRLGQACKDIAEMLQLPGWNDPKANPVQLICTFMAKSGTEQDLVVLDNVDDITILEEDLDFQNMTITFADFVRQLSSARILITTRDRRVGERLTARGTTVDVHSMALGEGQQLLRSYVSPNTDEDTADYDRLVESLDCLPLAITQAAAYIVEGCISVQEYHSMLREGDKQLEELLNESLIDERRSFQESNSPIKTWKISFDHIVKIDKRASEMLSIMAVFDRNQIQDFLLQRRAESRRQFLQAVATLQNFSLVSKAAESNTYKMHRLVQVATQAWLRVQGSMSNAKREAAIILAMHFPSGEYGTWQDCEALLPHMRLLTSQTHDSPEVEIIRARLLAQLARLYRCQGHYRDGISTAREACQIFQRLKGLNDPEALFSVVTEFDCRMALFEDVLIGGAEVEFRKVVASLEEQLGLGDPEALRGLGNLAFALYQRDSIHNEIPEEAILLLRKVLSLREEVLGVDHFDCMTTLGNLALALDSKRYLAYDVVTEEEMEAISRESEDLFRECIRRRRKHLGPEHPHTLESEGNLGCCLVKRGSFEEAEMLLRSTITSREALLGPSNTDSIPLTTSLIECLQFRGSTEESIKIGREGLAKAELHFGPSHRETCIITDLLAGDLSDAGNFDEALRYWRMILIHGKKAGVNILVDRAARSIVRLALDERPSSHQTSDTEKSLSELSFALTEVILKGTSDWHRNDLDDVQLLRLLRHAPITTLQNTDPLPQDWEVRLSTTNDVYFANTITQATSWLDPRLLKSDLEQDDPATRHIAPPFFHDRHISPSGVLYGLISDEDIYELESSDDELLLGDERLIQDGDDKESRPSDDGSTHNSDLSEEHRILALRTQGYDPNMDDARRRISSHVGERD